MEKILFINACVRPESRTNILAQHILGQLDGNVEELNLEKEKIEPLNRTSLDARNAYIDNGDFSAPMFNYAKQFAEADVIVMAAPYWELSFPAMVKNYIEAISVVGLTFIYTPEGRPAGLCKAKKLIYVTTAGGPILEPDFGFDYIKALCHNFYGIQDLTCFSAEMLDIVGADVDKILEEKKKEIDENLKNNK